MTKCRPNTATLLPLDEYDRILVSYSGGKDSLACLLDLFERGVPREKIELWHQDVGPMMDWPCTKAYVEATAKAFGLGLVYAWRYGTFEQEMLRNNEPTAMVMYNFDGDPSTTHGLPTVRQTRGTRMKFPQVSADLSVRWCSAYLKIDVAARVLANSLRFNGKKILFITGERRQESAARARYAEVEKHRTDCKRRTVHQWRSVIDWDEKRIWEIIERWKIQPHPAYQLGWGRVFCMACIFGDRDQWASVRKLTPERFAIVAGYERSFQCTIKRGESVVEQADKGTEFVSDKPADLVALALSHQEFKDLVLKDGEWKVPSGAFKRCGGPC